MIELPKLTDKQEKFILKYLTNGNNAREAYKQSYDCEKSTEATIDVEASKLLKHPKVALWLKQANCNVQEVFQEEIKYSVKDCFDEIEEMKKEAMNCGDKYGNPNVGVALKAVELKGKLAGHFVDKHVVAGGGLADVLDRLN